MLPLSITINFAGNLSDKGGPYWQPPGENIKLDGIWSDGYYTNDSRQHEDWIYINLSVLHPTGASNQYTASNVSNVWLQWLNDTAWTNWSYKFGQAGNYWEYNTSGFIPTREGYDYSFNIVANDTANNSYCCWWNKTGIGGGYTRRFVQLGCDPIDISYTPLYLFNYTSGTGNPPTYGFNDVTMLDRLHHDQGPDGSLDDSGYLSNYDQTLTDSMHLRYCGGFVGYFFEDSKCIESFELKNVYYHIWSACSDGLISTYWRKIRFCPIGGPGGYEKVNFDYDSDSHSSIYWDNGLPNHSDVYKLVTAFRNSTASVRNFTDNDIFEYVLEIDGCSNHPSTICNRSINSFILINLPNNNTLIKSDLDNDNLSDWNELFKTFTNPFLRDTDNDGIDDENEIKKFTDPNDYTDY